MTKPQQPQKPERNEENEKDEKNERRLTRLPWCASRGAVGGRRREVEGIVTKSQPFRDLSAERSPVRGAGPGLPRLGAWSHERC